MEIKVEHSIKLTDYQLIKATNALIEKYPEAVKSLLKFYEENGETT